jgi:hypothetical protein
MLRLGLLSGMNAGLVGNVKTLIADLSKRKRKKNDGDKEEEDEGAERKVVKQGGGKGFRQEEEVGIAGLGLQSCGVSEKAAAMGSRGQAEVERKMSRRAVALLWSASVSVHQQPQSVEKYYSFTI